MLTYVLFYRFRHRGPIERCENKAGTTRSTINIKRIKKYHGHHERQIIIVFFIKFDSKLIKIKPFLSHRHMSASKFHSTSV